MGLTFWCPHCVGTPGATRLGVAFANPLDGGKSEKMVEHHDGHGQVVPHAPEPEWQRSGETFAVLTLTPSVDSSKSGHWHGFITNGEVT
jgi:hypothetical protein